MSATNRDWDTWCPQCGPNVKCDDDGTCAHCGCDCIGLGVDAALALLDAAEAVIEEDQNLAGDDKPTFDGLQAAVAKCGNVNG
jgi:hypothetical protein